MINTHRILPKNLKERDHFGELGVNWRIILRFILKN
jgi:hypothetical protein